jgi:hypothetical protein
MIGMLPRRMLLDMAARALGAADVVRFCKRCGSRRSRPGGRRLPAKCPDRYANDRNDDDYGYAGDPRA